MFKYDVFLSHSSVDKPAVEILAVKLRETGLRVFFDKWALVPGTHWQDALQKALASSRTCAVFLGAEPGPWHTEEMRVALSQRVEKEPKRVIPVLLPGVQEQAIPLFLQQRTWVDFRAGLDDETQLERLVAGIQGSAPTPSSRGLRDRVAMETALPRRIVQVEATFTGNRQKRGTGLRIKPGWILTSQHVLEQAEDGTVERAEKIEVVLAAPGHPRAPAKVEWLGEEQLDTEDIRALDAALLSEQELPAEDEEIELVRLHLPSAACEVAGWISLSDEWVGPDALTGRFDAMDETATLLPLRIDGTEPKSTDGPSSSGILGAPVFVASGPYRGQLYGVIRKAPASQPDRFYAVSAPALLRNERFRQLLEISAPPPPHERLILGARQLLNDRPHLAARLAKADTAWRAAWEAEGQGGGVDGLVAALCERSDLKKLLSAVETIAEDGAEDRQRIKALRQWAGHLTGLLAQQFMLSTGRRLEQDQHRVKVPLGSPGFADAVLAADHGEAPRYERRDGTQRPVLQVPASQLEHGIRAQRRAEDQLEILADKLLREDLATPRFLSEIELEIIDGEETQKQFETRLEAMRLALEDYCDRQGTRRRPYLLITPHLRRLDQNGTLEAFLVYLAELLPQLEQVELRGDAKESLQLENQLKPLWRILGIDKGEDG